MAHLITDLDIGGAERMLTRIVTSRPSAWRHTVIYMTGAGPLAPACRAAGANVIPLNMDRGRVELAAIARTVRALRGCSPDVLQTWLYHADLLGTAARFVSQKVPMAWNIRCVDVDFSQYGAGTRRAVRLLARLSRLPDVVVTNSKAGRSAHERLGYRPRRWATIPNGFDTTVLRPDERARRRVRDRLGVSNDTVLFGMVARVDPAKGHSILLDAMGIVRSQRRDVRLYLVGTAVPDLVSAVRARGLSDVTILEDALDDVAEIYAALDVHVLSSKFAEAFPNAVGEAMSCGTPCVATALGDLDEILGGTGLLATPGDPGSLAEAMLEAASWSQGERMARGAAARERVRRHYSIETVIERYETLWEELVCVD